MDAVDVAAFFKEKGKDKYQVMKLTYYAQGLYLKLYDEPLFDDPIEAWEKGPVPRTAYDAFHSLEYDPSSMNLHYLSFLEDVAEEFDSLDSEKLIQKTHEEDPWKQAYVENQRNIISQDSMKAFFNNFPMTVAEKRLVAQREKALSFFEKKANGASAEDGSSSSS